MTSPRSRSTKATAADIDQAICPKCNGSGYVINPDTWVAAPCDCPAYTQATLLSRQRSAGVPPRFSVKTLDNFQAAKGERELGEILKAARAYANSFNSSEPLGLLLRGIPGSGKTHIAVGIMHIVLQRGYTARYDNFSDLLSRIRESFSPDSDWSEAELLENVNKADLLVLDDLGAESTSDWVRDRLYLIINRRYESGRAVIITTNCDEHELSARVGERTASRLCEMCQVPFPPFPKVDWRRKMMH